MNDEGKTPPFWRRKTLDEMNSAEWESLCDGCGRCCLVKLEDEDTGRILHTDVGCRLLDAQACRCTDYAKRQRRVPDCLRLTPASVRAISWLPPTCAYLLVRERRDLYPWHHLVCGDPNAVHVAGVSVRGRVSVLEDEIAEDDLPEQIVKWPGQVPRQKR